MLARLVTSATSARYLSRRRALAATFAISVSVTVCHVHAAPIETSDAEQFAADAYVYAYPLVLMDISRQVMTSVSKPTTRRSPINQFSDSREFPDPTFTDVVSPNADTLYSSGWLDLTKEPIVLRLPETGNRYYLMQMLDAWTNVFASPGTRTTGNGAGNYAIVGPGWKGQLPAGVNEIKSPTNMVWIIGRTQTNGKRDYEAVRALKKNYKLVPLSDWGKKEVATADVPVNSSIDTKTPPVVQVGNLPAEELFNRFALLLTANPPAAADAPIVEQLAQIGIFPGQPFKKQQIASETFAAIEKGVKKARADLFAESKNLKRVPRVNSWTMALDLGRYGTDYRRRANIAMVGLGANLVEDSIYPMTTVDVGGKPLSGEHRYELTFSKDQLPPVNAFWSLTMYNSKRLFVANPIERYAIGDRDKLQFNSDGSLTLYLQHKSPGKEKESNWLPAPSDSMILMLRLYWPKSQVLEGKWNPPPIRRIE